MVEVIARNTGAAVGVQGAEAARQLGLTTQVPSKTIFLTTGPSRNVMVGEVHIQLKHVAPRKLTLAGTPAGIALTALWYMGKSQVNPEVIAVIANKLTSQEFENLRSAKSVMPAWMTDAFYRYEQKQCG
ncbi:MAG: DUF6088 family protein [Myxococcota bacterium]